MNKQLQQRIIQAKDIDQKTRLACRSHKLTMKNYMVYLVDLVNNDLIKHIIKKHGYPTQKLIDKKGMKAFWLLIQHQDNDVKLQEQCLKYCDFEDKNKAFLTDRVLVSKGKKQLYGTQFYRNEKGKIVPRSIKNPSQLNKRREKVGLESFEEYLKKMQK